MSWPRFLGILRPTTGATETDITKQRSCARGFAGWGRRGTFAAVILPRALDRATNGLPIVSLSLQPIAHGFSALRRSRSRDRRLVARPSPLSSSRKSFADKDVRQVRGVTICTQLAALTTFWVGVAYICRRRGSTALTNLSFVKTASSCGRPLSDYWAPFGGN